MTKLIGAMLEITLIAACITGCAFIIHNGDNSDARLKEIVEEFIETSSE